MSQETSLNSSGIGSIIYASGKLRTCSGSTDMSRIRISQTKVSPFSCSFLVFKLY